MAEQEHPATLQVQPPLVGQEAQPGKQPEEQPEEHATASQEQQEEDGQRQHQHDDDAKQPEEQHPEEQLRLAEARAKFETVELSAEPPLDLDGVPGQVQAEFEALQTEIYEIFDNDQLFVAADKQAQLLAFLLQQEREDGNAQAAELFRAAVLEPRFTEMHKKLAQSNSLLDQLAQDATQEPWKLLHQSHGTVTSYRQEPGSDNYTFKVTSTLRGDVVRIIAVLNEVNLFKDWFPFMSKSVELRQVSRFRKQFILTLWFPWPLADRDMLLDGWGIDMMEQSQTIINVSSLPEDHELSVANPPPKGVVRGTLNGGFRIGVVDRDSVALTMLLHINMQLTNLSPRMVNYFSGKLIHALPSKVEQAAPKPVYGERIEQQPHVYAHIADIVQRYWTARDAEKLAAATTGQKEVDGAAGATAADADQAKIVEGAAAEE